MDRAVVIESIRVNIRAVKYHADKIEYLFNKLLEAKD